MLLGYSFNAASVREAKLKFIYFVISKKNIPAVCICVQETQDFVGFFCVCVTSLLRHI